jgi:hypothetical protein
MINVNILCIIKVKCAPHKKKSEMCENLSKKCGLDYFKRLYACY